MNYLFTFIEGVASFISPCMLPMVPIYISYFAGKEAPSQKKKLVTLIRAIGFVIGFSISFILLSILVSSIGEFLHSRNFIY